jgi:hypothetical protein
MIVTCACFAAKYQVLVASPQRAAYSLLAWGQGVFVERALDRSCQDDELWGRLLRFAIMGPACITHCCIRRQLVYHYRPERVASTTFFDLNFDVGLNRYGQSAAVKCFLPPGTACESTRSSSLQAGEAVPQADGLTTTSC